MTGRRRDRSVCVWAVKLLNYSTTRPNRYSVAAARAGMELHDGFGSEAEPVLLLDIAEPGNERSISFALLALCVGSVAPTEEVMYRAS